MSQIQPKQKVKESPQPKENKSSDPITPEKGTTLAFALFFFWNHPYIKVLIPAFATVCCVMAELVSIIIGLGLPAIIFMVQALSMIARRKENISFWSIAAFSEHLRETKLFRVSGLALHLYLVVCVGLWIRAQVATQEELAELGFPYNEMGNTWALFLGIFTTATATYDLLTYDGAFTHRKIPLQALEIGLFSELIKATEKYPKVQKLRLKIIKYNLWNSWLLWPNYLLFKLFCQEHYEWWTDSQSFFSNLRTITSLVLIYPDSKISDLKDMPEYSDIDWDLVINLEKEDYKDLKNIFCPGLEPIPV